MSETTEYAAVVTVTVRAIDGVEQAADMLREIARRLQRGHVDGSHHYPCAGNYEFSTAFDVPMPAEAKPITPTASRGTR